MFCFVFVFVFGVFFVFFFFQAEDGIRDTSVTGVQTCALPICESVFRAVFTTLAVFMVGAPIWMVLLYQSFSVVLSQFNHANIHLPELVNKVLSWVFVTPNMHHVHHHQTQPLTDTNYGNIFSIWDRLFGTFAYVTDPQTIVYGIDTYPDSKEHSHIGGLLKIPFQNYRQSTTAHPKNTEF